MEELDRALEILGTIIEDTAVPKNIKEICRASVTRLNNEDEKIHIRIGAVINMLDELSQDSNLPCHTRTQIWEVASLLETASNNR